MKLMKFALVVISAVLLVYFSKNIEEFASVYIIPPLKKSTRVKTNEVVYISKEPFPTDTTFFTKAKSTGYINIKGVLVSEVEKLTRQSVLKFDDESVQWNIVNDTKTFLLFNLVLNNYTILKCFSSISNGKIDLLSVKSVPEDVFTMGVSNGKIDNNVYITNKFHLFSPF